jgi:hypothetical protein
MKGKANILNYLKPWNSWTPEFTLLNIQGIMVGAISMN